MNMFICKGKTFGKNKFAIEETNYKLTCTPAAISLWQYKTEVFVSP